MTATEDDLTSAPVSSSAAHSEPTGDDTDATNDQSAAGKTGPAGWQLGLVTVGLVLAALNLRPAIASLGPLLAEVRQGLGMSGTVAGLLTSVPALCFAAFGGLAPRLARRWGPGGVVLAGMAAITAGLALRPLAGGTALFLLASAGALAGIAVSNVLMPVVVKHWFPDRVGSMTGLYSMGLSLGTAGAAALTVPLTNALGGNWRTGLGVWAVVGVAAMVPWTMVLWGRSARTAAAGSVDASSRTAQTSAEAAAGEDLRITRSPTAWALAVFFGLQASAAYIVMGWLPQIFRDAGVPASTAGVMLAVTMGLGVPLSFVLPRIAARMRHQGPLALALGVCGLTGYAGLWFAPGSGAWLWALVLGVANCAFPLVLTMLGMRSRSDAGVVKLSAFAQSTGYLLSIPGPLLVGALREYSGGWHLPLVLMAGLMVVQMAVGVLAGRDRCVEDGD